MNTDENSGIQYIEQEEKTVEEIRSAALRKVQMLYPEATYVIDPRTIDDYCYIEWDYPGVWYSRGFKLPDGFKDKDELIDDIVKRTLRHFDKKK